MNPIVVRSRNPILRASLDAGDRRRVQMLSRAKQPVAPAQPPARTAAEKTNTKT